MQKQNLILQLDTLYNFFKENDYHLIRLALPIITPTGLIRAGYTVLHCDGMKEALTQVEQGNIQLYNSLNKEMIYEHPMYIEELLASLETDFNLDVTSIHDLLDEHTTSLKELGSMMYDTEAAFGTIPEDDYTNFDNPYFIVESFNNLLLNLLNVELEYDYLLCWGHLLDSIIAFTINELIPAYKSTPLPLPESKFHQKLKDNFIKLQILANLHTNN